MLSQKLNMWLSRLLPYWLTVIGTCWTLAFFYTWNAPKAYERYIANTLKIFVAIEDDEAIGWSDALLGFMTPLLLVASISTLLITNATLPANRLSWVNKVFAYLRVFPAEVAEHGVALYKKNQFGVGQPEFNLMAFWLVFFPGMMLFCTYIHQTIEYAHDPEVLTDGVTARQRSVEYVSYTAGWAGTVVLSFFLIPVTRHSVLLAAMNWSPVHALRIHIWAGYLSFFFIFLHGIMIVGVWFKWAPGAIYEELIPPKECWSGPFPEESRCAWQFYNFTGTIAMIFFTIVWVSSMNWFRRKWYRLFYILHVVFGTLTLLSSIWHFEFIGLYLLPSILYYLASTMPTLVQALASRFRGGVKIMQVVVLDDANDCLEVRISIDPTAQGVLSSTHPSKYIKLCAPGISLVWHPFTVYNHPNDPTTLRMMFRPIGPFTKALRLTLVNPDNRPVTMIDGFYRGNDHCHQALMCHDHVTIVAGGVAITPFISMVFAILKELSSFKMWIANNTMPKQAQPLLRSLTLIWSCRELGLLSFVKHNYLEDMTRWASSIGMLDFTIKIFYTGSNPESNIERIENDGEEVFSDSIHKNVDEEELGKKEGPQQDPPMDTHNAVNHQTISFQDENDVDSKDINSGGHDMELARVMPGRYSRMIWNIPYFVAFTGSVWLGFHFMFFPYDSIPSFRDYSEEAYITMMVIAFFFGIGIIIECSVLLFRKYWPAPRYDDFELVSPLQNNPKKELLGVSDSANTVGTMQYYTGRPNSENMLAEASQASAPGLFVCGPVGMVQVLRAAAGKENSTLGCLTRYTIYEESFEM